MEAKYFKSQRANEAKPEERPIVRDDPDGGVWLQMTVREANVLEGVKDLVGKHRRSPTMAELGDWLGMSDSLVQYLVNDLRTLGYLLPSVPKAPRSIWPNYGASRWVYVDGEGLSEREGWDERRPSLPPEAETAEAPQTAAERGGAAEDARLDGCFTGELVAAIEEAREESAAEPGEFVAMPTGDPRLEPPGAFFIDQAVVANAMRFAQIEDAAAALLGPGGAEIVVGLARNLHQARGGAA